VNTKIIGTTVDGPAKSCTTNFGWLKPKQWDVYHLSTGAWDFAGPSTVWLDENKIVELFILMI